MLENTGKDIHNTNKAELKKQKGREYYLKNKEQFRERYQRYRENDIETFRRRNRERKKKCYDENPENIGKRGIFTIKRNVKKTLISKMNYIGKYNLEI